MIRQALFGVLSLPFLVVNYAAAQPIPLPQLSRQSNPELAKFAESAKTLSEKFTPTEVRGYLKGAAKPADLSKEPYIYAGRLQTDRGSCSAQLVAHQSMVLTAAHCVYDNGSKTWAKTIQFVRAYGSEKAETHEFECVAVTSGWANSKRYSDDYAWIKLKTPGPTYLGIIFGAPLDDFMAIGYPINFGQTQTMHEVNGTLGSKNSGYGLASMVANTMTNGSSGGAWLNYKNQVLGLNSFTYVGKPYVMYSPLFNERVMTPFNRLLDGKPDESILKKCNI